MGKCSGQVRTSDKEEKIRGKKKRKERGATEPEAEDGEGEDTARCINGFGKNPARICNSNRNCL